MGLGLFKGMVQKQKGVECGCQLMRSDLLELNETVACFFSFGEGEWRGAVLWSCQCYSCHQALNVLSENASEFNRPLDRIWGGLRSSAPNSLYEGVQKVLLRWRDTANIVEEAFNVPYDRKAEHRDLLYILCQSFLIYLDFFQHF